MHGGQSHPGKSRGTLECESSEGRRHCHLVEVAQNVLYLKLAQRLLQPQLSREESEKKVWLCYVIGQEKSQDYWDQGRHDLG